MNDYALPKYFEASSPTIYIKITKFHFELSVKRNGGLEREKKTKNNGGGRVAVFYLDTPCIYKLYIHYVHPRT